MGKRKAAAAPTEQQGGKAAKGSKAQRAEAAHADGDGPSTSGAVVAAPAVRNKEKVLLLSSRGITYR